MAQRLLVISVSFIICASCGSGSTSADGGVQASSDSGLRLDAGRVAADAGRGDAGATDTDAGHVADDAGAGGLLDAGQRDAGPALTWVPLQGPRRGPIELTFATSAGDFTSFSLQLDRAGFVAATVWSNERTPNRVTIVWDSFKDVETDSNVTLRLVGARAGASDEIVSFTLDVRNALDPARILSVSHALVDGTGGSVNSTGKGLSLVRWNGATDGGTVVKRFDVVRAIARVRAAPHGRSTAVLGASQLVLVTTPLDGNPSASTATDAVTLPGAPVDFRWSRDGRFIFVLVASDAGRAPTIEVLRVKEDQSGLDAPVTLAQLDRPPLRFDVDRSTGRFVVVVGTGPSASTGKLLLLEPDGGSAAAALDRDWGVTNALTLSREGDLAVLTSNYGSNGDEVFMVDVSPSGFGTVTVRTSIQSPYDVVFSPRSTSTTRTFVVSQQQSNSVTAVSKTGSTVTVRPKVSGIPLAFELDMVERGPRTGSTFAVAVAAIYGFVLTDAGIVSTPTVVHDFGAGATNEPTGIAVQR